MKKKLPQTVFLDRDGVINIDSSAYIKTWEEFTFIDGSLEAIRRLTENKFHIILITNQSVINRGMVPRQELERIFSMMKQKITAAGGRITDIFYCPHTPDDGCDCRKPLPGLIYQAMAAYEIDLQNSFMVGDSAKDIQCARNAGCGNAILVQTGNGLQARETLSRENIFPDYVAQNLLDAARWMIGSVKPT